MRNTPLRVEGGVQETSSLTVWLDPTTGEDCMTRSVIGSGAACVKEEMECNLSVHPQQWEYSIGLSPHHPHQSD